jgi:tetratricopeptide (TPR) repeat protein
VKLSRTNRSKRNSRRGFQNSLDASLPRGLARHCRVHCQRQSTSGAQTEVNVNLLLNANVSEAKTFHAFNHAEWSDVIVNANIWAHNEGFSARPRVLASSVAASLLGDLELAEEIGRNGLMTNPGHPALINNIAFAMINAGKATEAMKLLETVNRHVITPTDAICLVATAGLAYYRLGNPTEGKRHYDLAIEAATRQNNRVLRTTARLYLARERVLQNDPEGLKEFRKAHDEAKKFQDTSLPFVAERLAKQVIDVEIKKTGNEVKNITLK